MFNRNTDLSAYGFDGSDEFLRRFRNFIGRFAAARQGSAGSDSDAAGLDPFTGVVDVNAARRHERGLRQGTVDGFYGRMPTTSPGKILTTSAPHSRAVTTSFKVVVPGMTATR